MYPLLGSNKNLFFLKTLLQSSTMNRYLISKICFAIFSLTTIAIFILLESHYFVYIAGSTEVAIVIFAINAALLVSATLWYIWEKSHKDMPKSRDAEILEAYSEREHENKES